MKRTRTTLLVVLILWIGLPLPSAFAHAGLITSTPSSGARLTVLPSQVKLEFGENLLTLGDAQTNVLLVKDPDGVQISESDSSISGRFFFVSLNPSNKGGTFTVDWRIVSEDGHPVEGSFQFSVASPLTVTPVVSPSPTLSPSSTASTDEIAGGEEISFWNRYQSRILLGIVFLTAIIIWIRFKRLNKG
ncbi:MAG: copper resistance protein CopC [Candidatus Nanopelagicaceae bacterium]|nr:copper resistance protein CopC [Candidatus Nanopelagicaceae bacterium]